MLNEKAELGISLEVDAEGHAKVDLGASAGLSGACFISRSISKG